MYYQLFTWPIHFLFADKPSLSSQSVPSAPQHVNHVAKRLISQLKCPQPLASAGDITGMEDQPLSQPKKRRRDECKRWVEGLSVAVKQLI